MVTEEEGKATVLSFAPYRFFRCLEKRICSEIATAHQFSPKLWDFRFFNAGVLVMGSPFVPELLDFRHFSLFASINCE